VLEAVGIELPSVINGVTQRPFEGVPLGYTFLDEKAPTTRTTQYFEMFANQGIYHDGW